MIANTIDLATLTPNELTIYAAGYADAIQDTADHRARAAASIADLEQQLAAARADAAYWARIANPIRVTTGPSRAELQTIRRELVTARSNQH